ncbi:hypothetical protein B0T25DRAFT_265901 [Lasiosphaeria hispida]|uniref:Fucose-specific lectin n=1 Tax=Lasiosphaeria hispida TaxID=260671 RepID=A0AAJ0HAB7_9PEZI|nr:hypothetical protein B0T25DRAFT_265901 [Lasiosphaeria hispida]
MTSYEWGNDLNEGGPRRDGDGSNQGFLQHPAHLHPQTPRKSKRWIWVAIGVIIAVVLALGLGIGLTIGRKASTSADNKPPIPTPPGPKPPIAPPGDAGRPTILLAETKLATVHRDDTLGNDIHAVYYQSASGALMVSQWNSSTRAWNATNISAALDAVGRPIRPQNGTALAVDHPNGPVQGGTDDGFLVNVRYVSVADNPEYIVGPAAAAGAWTLGTLSNYAPPPVSKGSQMAAIYDGCASGCTGTSVFLYENASQELIVFKNVFGNRDWDQYRFEEFTSFRVVPEPGAALTMTRFTPSGERKEATGLRMYVDVSRQLQEYSWTGGDAQWVHTSKQWPLSDPDARDDTYHAPWISATSWNSTAGSGPKNILLALLFNNGSIVVHWLDEPTGSWATGFPSPTNVSALALNDNMRAYCVQNGQIREYDIDMSRPASWKFVSNVTSLATDGST